MNGKPTLISTFAGCGGSSLGYKQVGFKELLAIDFEKHAVETFGLNFPGIPVWEKNIKEVTGKEILKFCKIKLGELDVLDGSPPCQGFSLSGSRNINDGRNQLFLEFIRLIKELRPKVFVMENVPGMIRGKMKGLFKEIMITLKDSEYKVKCKLLNSKYYGVPQARERLFWIGVRKDLKKQPKFPIPNPKTVSIKKALKEVPSDKEIKVPTGKAGKLCDQIKPGEGMDIIFEKLYGKPSYFNVRKLSWYKPSFTVTKTFSTSAAGLLHPEIKRYMTISEIKRLCSFPDNFKLKGLFAKKWARMGNAVMPKQMEAIANTIKNDILL